MRLPLAVVVLLAALPALAAPVAPPPPRSPRSRAIHESLLRWQERVVTACLPAVRDDADLNRLAAEISRHTAYPDQAVYADYFNQILIPAYAAGLDGVAGFGTYVEIYVHAQRSRRELEATLPKGPAGTEAELRAFVAAWRAYEERAAAEREWLSKLRAASPCHRDEELATMPLLSGFKALDEWVDPGLVRARLVDVRDGLAPAFRGGPELDALVAEIEVPAAPALPRSAELVGETMRLLGDLEKLDRRFSLLPLWAELYEGDEKVELLARPAGVGERKVQIRLALAKLVGAVEPPAQTTKDKTAAKIAQDLAKGRAGKVLTVRVLDARTIEVAESIKVEQFHFAFVGDARPISGWPDLPDLPSSDVCCLMIGTAKRYIEGQDVPLKRWIFQEDVKIPIPCKNKDRPGKPL